LRPNQIFAVSLPISPLPPSRQRGVVDACARVLLTPAGLRSLDPANPAYAGTYIGDQRQRDGAYHQGTVWAWLKGPFIEACLRVYGNVDRVRALLDPMGDLIDARGIGTIGEIYDGDAPFLPRGCIAQAWSVATVLHAWQAIEDVAVVTT
jgi:glycogen debranching enzyme